jgi:hypothetical protein
MERGRLARFVAGWKPALPVLAQFLFKTSMTSMISL